MIARSYFVAALAAGAVLTAGVVSVLNLAPASAVAHAPISTIAPTMTAQPALATPVADITAARSAGQRAEELVAEREAAATKAAAQRDQPDYYRTSGDAQRAWDCQQGYITDGCSGVNGPKPSEAEQRRRIADGSVPVGGGYAPGSAEYKICSRNPVASVCGG